MPKVMVEESTFLKKKLLGAGDLTKSEKIFMPKGKEFFVTEFAPDRNQHFYLKLASPMTADDGQTKLEQVYAYDPHIKVEGEEACQVIKLKVNYLSQLNNEEITAAGQVWYDWRQCNTTSNAMLADYLLKGELSKRAKDKGYKNQDGKPEPESAYMRIVADYGDTIDHEAQTKALKELKIESYFSYKVSGNDLLTALKLSIPVVAGFAYKDAGHICLIVGHDPSKKVWLVHDPYGTRHGSSNNYDVGIGGAFDSYSYDVMQRIFWDQGREAGWGRIVTSVNGKPTGLPTGL